MASVLSFQATVGGSFGAVVTVDFLSAAADYRVVSWSPAVAVRRSGGIAGRTPYEDVIEEMEIVIGGSDPLTNLRTLQTLIEQSSRFSRGENVGAVLFRYQPTSGSPLYQTTLLGAPDGAPMIELPSNFINSPSTTKIDPVILRFKRIGVWLAPSILMSSATTTHPSPANIASFSDTGISSPYEVTVKDVPANDEAKSFLLIAGGANTTAAAANLVVANAEGGTAAGWTSVVDTANDARNGSVLRYTPTGTSESTSGAIAVPLTFIDTYYYAVYVNYRNNSATTSFNLRLRYGTVMYTPFYRIPAGISNPAWVFVGLVATNGSGTTSVNLQCQASAASGTLDIDTIVMLAVGSVGGGQAIAIKGGDPIASTADLVLDHNLLDGIAPSVRKAYGAPYSGNATIFLDGDVARCAWLSPSSATPASWVSVVGGNALASNFELRQTPAYLTPD